MAEKNKQEPQQQQQQFKIFFVGDGQVGKTCILHKITKKIRNSVKYKPTCGFNSQNWEFEVSPNKFVAFDLWDTAGNEKYRGITKHHYKYGVGAIIVYDVTKEDSFCNVKSWIEEIQSYCIDDDHNHPHIIVLGNKKDLRSKKKISLEEATEKVKEQFKEIDVFEISTVSEDQDDNRQFDKIINMFFKKIYEELKKRCVVHEIDGNQRLNDKQVVSSQCCCC